MAPTSLCILRPTSDGSPVVRRSKCERREAGVVCGSLSSMLNPRFREK